MKRCRSDFFFFLETFAWLLEPRPEPGKSSIFPFIPWIHQRPVMRSILRNLGYCDIGLEKARGEGATWMCLYIFIWRWLFWDTQFFGIVSRNEKSADNPEDPDSLGAKIDWALSRLPKWMLGEKDSCWRRNISRHSWVRRGDLTRSDKFDDVLPEDFAGAGWGSQDHGNAITAYPTTGDMMSGGRKTAIMLDEFAKHERGPDADCLASTGPVTNCRMLVSTYWGMHGAYYEAMKTAHLRNMVKLQLLWTDNPYRNKNLFRINVKQRKLVSAYNRDIELKGEYSKEFWKRDGLFDKLRQNGYDVDDKAKLWSPWYVNECLRQGMNPKVIAQEYDIDPAGSGDSFFSPRMIEERCKRARQPNFVGDLGIDYDHQIVTYLSPRLTGAWRMWLNYQPDEYWRPPPASYVVAADIAVGLGGSYGSNSTLSVVNISTGQKVAEYADPKIKPERFAELAIAVCKYFRDQEGHTAYLIWESNGAGGIFRQRIMQSDFRNFHWRKAHDKTRKKPTKEPGWWSTPRSKFDLLGKYRYAMEAGFFANPSELALRECLQYQITGPERVEYLGISGGQDDPSNVGENHGDRVIADALANYAMEELGGGFVSGGRASRQRVSDPPQGSFAYRQQQRQREWRNEHKPFWGERDPRKLRRW